VPILPLTGEPEIQKSCGKRIVRVFPKNFRVPAPGDQRQTINKNMRRARLRDKLSGIGIERSVTNRSPAIEAEAQYCRI
jgi:hypothetical protein